MLKQELGFDNLTALIGMDWGELLGVVYYLTNTATNEIISAKVTTDNRKDPMLHSLTDLYAVAGIYEREVYDFYGIKFINHPDMRRLFLRNDWGGDFLSARTTTQILKSTPCVWTTNRWRILPAHTWKALTARSRRRTL